MSIVKNQKSLLRFEYDFDKDGGAIGAIPLRADVTGLKAGMLITDAYVVVESAITSGGTPTMILGNTTDDDGYFADFFASVSGSAAGLRAGEVAGALIWDDTNDHHILYAPAVADDLDLNITVGTAALTAGKLSVYLEVIAKEI